MSKWIRKLLCWLGLHRNCKHIIPKDTLTYDKMVDVYKSLIDEIKYPPINNIRVHRNDKGTVNHLSNYFDIMVSDVVPEGKAIMLSGNDFCGVLDFNTGQGWMLSAEKFREIKRKHLANFRYV